VRFVSAEPLLGPIDLTHLTRYGASAAFIDNALDGFVSNGCGGRYGEHLDWVIAGGESGPGARPMIIQWVRGLRDQCASAAVPFFFKQWGEWAPAGLCRSGDPGRFAFGDYEQDRSVMIRVDEYPRQFTRFGACSVMARVGKKAAGSLLDGAEHKAYPPQLTAR
jgi:hypothetical protein